MSIFLSKCLFCINTDLFVIRQNVISPIIYFFFASFMTAVQSFKECVRLCVRKDIGSNIFDPRQATFRYTDFALICFKFLTVSLYADFQNDFAFDVRDFCEKIKTK